jgi:hypothetical protein
MSIMEVMERDDRKEWHVSQGPPALLDIRGDRELAVEWALGHAPLQESDRLRACGKLDL